MQKIVLPIIILMLVIFSGCTNTGETNNMPEEVETFDSGNKTAFLKLDKAGKRHGDR